MGDHTYSDILEASAPLDGAPPVIPGRAGDAHVAETAEAGDWRRLQRIRRLRDEADREVDALALKLYRADMALMKEAELNRQETRKLLL